MLAQKTNLPGATSKLAQIQQMPVYSETEEVAKILKQMLDDLSTRLKVLEDVDAKAQEEADKTYGKMVEWEQKLVKLANDKDKAKQKMMEEQLQRQKLAGVKVLRSLTPRVWIPCTIDLVSRLSRCCTRPHIRSGKSQCIASSMLCELAIGSSSRVLTCLGPWA